MTSVAGKEQGMLHIYEFEVFEDEGLVIALPSIWTAAPRASISAKPARWLLIG